MTDEAFLAKLAADPADDTTRLVYADWLDDQGDADRAEYLRLAVGVAAGWDGGQRPVPGRLRELGRGIPQSWAAADRFEVVFAGIPPHCRSDVYDVLEHDLRVAREDLWGFVDAAPGTLADGLRYEAAADAAADLTDRAIAKIERPGWQTGAEFFRNKVEQFRVQVGGRREAIFVARPMGDWGTDTPRRFAAEAVSTAGGHNGIDADGFIEPLAKLLGLSDADARTLLYTNAVIPVREGLSFTAAVEVLQHLHRARKRHSMGAVLNEMVELSIAAGSPAAEGG